MTSDAPEVMSSGRWPWRRRPAVDVYLTPDGACGPGPEGLSPRPWGEWCAAHAGRHVRLWLHGQWLVEWSLPVEQARVGEPEALDLCRQALVDAFGDEAASWPLAHWRWGHSSGVTACRGTVLAEARREATLHGVRLDMVRPAWAVLPGAVAVDSTDGRWTLAEGDRLTHLDQSTGAGGRVSVEWEPGSLEGAYRRPEVGETGRTAAATGPSSWREWMQAAEHGPSGFVRHGRRRVRHPSFSPPEWGHSPASGRVGLAWTLAATCSVAAGLSILSAAEQWTTLEATRARLTPQAGSPRAQAPKAEAGDRERAGAAARARALARRASFGWDRVFLGMEAAAAGQWRWLGVEVDADTGALQAELLHGQPAAAWALPSTLDAAHWRAPVLRHLQPMSTGIQVAVGAQLAGPLSPSASAPANGSAP